MPGLDATDEEVAACFNLVLRHLKADGIAAYPFELRVTVEKRVEFVALLAAELRGNRYLPSKAPVAEVPKGAGAIRPVHLLSLRDQIAYAVIGLRCLPHIAREIQSGTQIFDFSSQIRDPIKASDWLYSYFKGWKSFGEASLTLLSGGAQSVVETDIAGFYENIDHALLISNLKHIGVPENVISILRSCLTAWISSRRGLPQSNLTSAVLAKLYLHSVDQQLCNEGIVHVRYSDDTRLFSKSNIESKKALQILIRLLRDKTLTIQTAKTRFMGSETAVVHFKGVTPLIERLRTNLSASKAREREVSLALSADYLSLSELIREASESVEIPIEVITTAYTDFIAGKVGVDFKKSVFHYLIGRLSYANDTFAVDDCLTRFVEQPQETRFILRYCLKVGLTSQQESMLLDFLEHDENIYAFQTFEILQYLSAISILNKSRVQSIARRFAFAAGPNYLKSQARFLLYIVGTSADTEAMYRAYVEAQSPLEQAELVCAISRMEVGRRNVIYTSIAEDSNWIVRTAVAIAKSGHIRAALVDTPEDDSDATSDAAE